MTATESTTTAPGQPSPRAYAWVMTVTVQRGPNGPGTATGSGTVTPGAAATRSTVFENRLAHMRAETGSEHLTVDFFSLEPDQL